MVYLGPDDGRFVWPSHVLEYAVFVWVVLSLSIVYPPPNYNRQTFLVLFI